MAVALVVALGMSDSIDVAVQDYAGNLLQLLSGVPEAALWPVACNAADAIVVQVAHAMRSEGNPGCKDTLDKKAVNGVSEPSAPPPASQFRTPLSDPFEQVNPPLTAQIRKSLYVWYAAHKQGVFNNDTPDCQLPSVLLQAYLARHGFGEGEVQKDCQRFVLDTAFQQEASIVSRNLLRLMVWNTLSLQQNTESITVNTLHKNEILQALKKRLLDQLEHKAPKTGNGTRSVSPTVCATMSALPSCVRLYLLTEVLELKIIPLLEQLLKESALSEGPGVALSSALEGLIILMAACESPALSAKSETLPCAGSLDRFDCASPEAEDFPAALWVTLEERLCVSVQRCVALGATLAQKPEQLQNGEIMGRLVDVFAACPEALWYLPNFEGQTSEFAYQLLSLVWMVVCSKDSLTRKSAFRLLRRLTRTDAQSTRWRFFFSFVDALECYGHHLLAAIWDNAFLGLLLCESWELLLRRSGGSVMRAIRLGPPPEALKAVIALATQHENPTVIRYALERLMEQDRWTVVPAGAVPERTMQGVKWQVDSSWFFEHIVGSACGISLLCRKNVTARRHYKNSLVAFLSHYIACAPEQNLAFRLLRYLNSTVHHYILFDVLLQSLFVTQDPNAAVQQPYTFVTFSTTAEWRGVLVQLVEKIQKRFPAFCRSFLTRRILALFTIPLCEVGEQSETPVVSSECPDAQATSIFQYLPRDFLVSPLNTSCLEKVVFVIAGGNELAMIEALCWNCLNHVKRAREQSIALLKLLATAMYLLTRMSSTASNNISTGLWNCLIKDCDDTVTTLASSIDNAVLNPDDLDRSVFRLQLIDILSYLPDDPLERKQLYSVFCCVRQMALRVLETLRKAYVAYGEFETKRSIELLFAGIVFQELLYAGYGYSCNNQPDICVDSDSAPIVAPFMSVLMEFLKGHTWKGSISPNAVLNVAALTLIVGSFYDLKLVCPLELQKVINYPSGALQWPQDSYVKRQISHGGISERVKGDLFEALNDRYAGRLFSAYVASRFLSLAELRCAPEVRSLESGKPFEALVFLDLLNGLETCPEGSMLAWCKAMDRASDLHSDVIIRTWSRADQKWLVTCLAKTLKNRLAEWTSSSLDGHLIQHVTRAIYGNPFFLRLELFSQTADDVSLELPLLDVLYTVLQESTMGRSFVLSFLTALESLILERASNVALYAQFVVDLLEHGERMTEGEYDQSVPQRRDQSALAVSRSVCDILIATPTYIRFVMLAFLENLNKLPTNFTGKGESERSEVTHQVNGVYDDAIISFTSHVLQRLVKCLVSRVKDARGLMVPNTSLHRLQLRVWQALCCIVSYPADRVERISGAVSDEDIRFLWEMLGSNAPPDIRYLMDVFFCRMVVKAPQRVFPKLIEGLKGFNVTTGKLASLLVIATYFLSEGSAASEKQHNCDPESQRRVTLLLENVAAHSVSHSALVRVTAQAGIMRWWNACSNKGVHQPPHSEIPSLVRAILNFTSSNKDASKILARMADALAAWDGAKEVTLSWLLPETKADLDAGSWRDEKLSFDGLDIKPSWTIVSFLNSVIAEAMTTIIHCPLIGSQVVCSTQVETSIETTSHNYQRKFSPWTPHGMEVDTPSSSPTRTHFSGIVTESRQSKAVLRRRLPLVVVASLIDKIPNLAGITRTCEVLGIQRVLLPSINVTRDAVFKSCAVNAEKWIPLEEVTPNALVSVLRRLRDQGYTLAALEQTRDSVMLGDVTFPQKTVLILGAEKEGVPAEILSLVDFSIEIPQRGITRSLNVHVSASLAIWTYCAQHMAEGAVENA